MDSVITVKGEVPARGQINQFDRWLFGLGNLGCAIPYQAVGAVALFYYVDVHRLNPVWAAAVMTGYAVYKRV